MNRGLLTSVASYELVAREYYDAQRHPTCANFRDGSRILFRRWLKFFDSRSQICEIGAGKSLLAEVLSEEHCALDTLILVDESPSMLAYSEAWRQDGVKLDLAPATALPYASESFDVVVSCLGDPYNTTSFWIEAHRVLRSGGKCFFTTPSYDWAAAYREVTNTDSMHNSEFELKDGSRVCLPSHIYAEHEQVQLIQSAGLTVSQVLNVSVKELPDKNLSPKLVLSRGPMASVVSGYVVLK